MQLQLMNKYMLIALIGEILSVLFMTLIAKRIKKKQTMIRTERRTTEECETLLENQDLEMNSVEIKPFKAPKEQFGGQLDQNNQFLRSNFYQKLGYCVFIIFQTIAWFLPSILFSRAEEMNKITPNFRSKYICVVILQIVIWSLYSVMALVISFKKLFSQKFLNNYIFYNYTGTLVTWIVCLQIINLSTESGSEDAFFKTMLIVCEIIHWVFLLILILITKPEVKRHGRCTDLIVSQETKVVLIHDQ
ncbi:hypothetical protein M0813_28786 [Anaeramoeba flamelloides]|uniref:Transmembrane protein n=1 Tax=Anaeramoeba flamelloides TaxID=1746091 RepID=A0ABQ8XTY4_9EUKA|nr:hypothetical protein M0813_28786 [Anaeramoeba flamelloides]